MPDYESMVLYDFFSVTITSFEIGYVVEKSSHLIWIDLEMTGLNPLKDRIIEMATVVTDKDLNIIAEGPCVAIHQPEKVMEEMDDWNKQHHGESGLWQRVRDSNINCRQAEKMTLEFLSELVPIHTSPMCGNSICQDRRFLATWMPELETYFHYRHIDVSTIKELIRRWNPDLLEGFSKTGQHLALADVKESIAELHYYRQHMGAIAG